MPVLNQPFEKFPELAELADRAGFDSLWTCEFFRNPFLIHALCAPRTRRIEHATGVATTCSRTPFEMANAAVDLDAITGGRAILGLATGGSGWTDVFNGAEVGHPRPRLREYVECLHGVWGYLVDETPFRVEGRFHRAASPPGNPWGLAPLARPRVPVYLSVVRPRMLQLAGEIADGVLCYMASPRYLEEVVVPNVELGLERAGRDRNQFEVTALVLCSVSADRREAVRRARINVGQYACYEGTDPMIEFEEATAARDRVRDRIAEGPAAFDLLDEDFVRSFAICGTPEEGRAQLAEYERVLDHVVLHTPYGPPLAQAESEDCFRQTVAAFAPAA